MIRAVLVSHFDIHLGPTISLSVPAMSRDELENFKVVPRLIDVAETEDFFISTLDKVYSANYHFSIENENTRGSKDLLLISIAVQVGDEDDKEQILLFLKKAEEPLRSYAQTIATNEGVKDFGIFSPENGTFLKDSLHGFFSIVFQKEQFDALFKQGQGRIAIFTHAGFDPMQMIEFFRKELHREKHPSLRTRLVVNAMDDFSYNPFHCDDRGSITCKKDECPPCNELIRESDAAIYIFDSGKFKIDSDFEDMVYYLKAIDHAKQLPVLVMQVDGDSTINGDLVYEEVTAKLQDAISQEGLMIQPKHGRVPIGNAEAFKECISWLIKEII